MAEAKEGEKAPKKKPNMALIGILVFALVNLGLVGAGAYLTYISTLGWESPQLTEESLAEQELSSEENSGDIPLLFTMDKFTVNLDGEPRRTLRVEVNLELLNKDGFEEVMSNDLKAKARDRIIEILNGRNYSDLESVQGKLFLKDQIATELNVLLDKGVVRDVYFSEFVAQ